MTRNTPDKLFSIYLGKTSTWSPKNLKFDIRFKVRFKNRSRFMVWVKDKVSKVKDRVRVSCIKGYVKAFFYQQWREIGRYFSYNYVLLLVKHIYIGSIFRNVLIIKDICYLESGL